MLAAHVEEEQLDKAKRVIERTLRNQIVKAVPTEFDVELRGIDAFGDKIVYAEVDKGEDHLRLINEKLLDAFEEVGFCSDAPRVLAEASGRSESAVALLASCCGGSPARPGCRPPFTPPSGPAEPLT